MILITNVARALCRKRQAVTLATRVTWLGLPQVSPETNGLLVLEKNAETLARGVFQMGKLVYLTAQGQENLEAVAALGTASFDALYYPLEIPAQALLCATVAGEALEVGVSKVLNQETLEQDLQLDLFDGALLLELGVQSIAVRIQGSQLSFSQDLSAVPTRYRCTKIKWLETNLPALTAMPVGVAPPASERLELMLTQFEGLIRLYLGLEAPAVMQATRAEVLGLNEQQVLEKLKAQLQRIGSSAVLDFEARIRR